MSSTGLDVEAGEVSSDASEGPELKKVTITMPSWMLDELRRRAKQRGITVTELIRRAVALEKMLFEDPASEVLLRNERTGKEVSIRVL